MNLDESEHDENELYLEENVENVSWSFNMH